jgi:hypothetical protein
MHQAPLFLPSPKDANIKRLYKTIISKLGDIWARLICNAGKRQGESQAKQKAKSKLKAKRNLALNLWEISAFQSLSLSLESENGFRPAL